MNQLKTIAKVRTDFPTKFGIPRQSGLVDGLKGQIVFEPEYRNPDALRGLEDFSHLWILWGFSEAVREKWSPTVRPPRLGGNTRMGVFATRSPFRPNPIGLSCVKLDGIVVDERLGSVLEVSGVDMMDGTPVYDIKPYLPQADCYPEAKGGFAERTKEYRLQVDIPECWLEKIPARQRDVLREVLAQDPRPSYQNDGNRVYGMEFGGMEIKFTVQEGVLTVCQVENMH